ncbi:aromatic ring-hydroxylating dioxygenase subunit alpha [Nostoc sp. CENA67]|uniref:cholesterol 7-desaturase n=1 Tax=Amazonocrinis nigriterrae CENA67 TaxID=2794033 RepID=A0A8J7L785_9NOST|nr:aromatic ring-hydroxylating dioxygenase subunit alpha [Amazonocrinis nigriterrae]MBH8561895.1 aromatic ring-hydroxylating dioxygenase subunit alpha [Amazonocrinis nigriterrae CENA67]
MKSRFPFTSFPNGWFRVGYSNELAIKEVKPLHYFGQDLVLFRTEDGIAHVMDAHCPHLGAHLGYGGCVKGETIQCPFHGWCFNGEGNCVEIPYTKKIPSKAQVKPWYVREIYGLILVWYHAEGKAPTWEIPELPEYNSPQWTPFRTVGVNKIYSHVQEIAENVMDMAHVEFLHGVSSAKGKLVQTEGTMLHWQWVLNDYPDSEDETLNIENYIDVSFYGFGYCVVHSHPGNDNPGEILIVALATPIDQEYVEGHQFFSLKKLADAEETAELEKSALETLKRESSKDNNIFEHKVYRTSPLLCEGEGQILKFRQWAGQFYSN